MVPLRCLPPPLTRSPGSSHARRWFEGALGTPTPAQIQGWPPIAAGEHVLVCAPTGSGKTLAAFLWFIDSSHDGAGRGPARAHVSPLKALNYDVQRNLRAPLAGIRASAAATGIELPAPSVAVRTGARRPRSGGAAAHAAGRPDHDAREPLPSC